MGEMSNFSQHINSFLINNLFEKIKIIIFASEQTMNTI